jgi:hypothetical protein
VVVNSQSFDKHQRELMFINFWTEVRLGAFATGVQRVMVGLRSPVANMKMPSWASRRSQVAGQRFFEAGSGGVSVIATGVKRKGTRAAPI